MRVNSLLYEYIFFPSIEFLLVSAASCGGNGPTIGNLFVNLPGTPFDNAITSYSCIVCGLTACYIFNMLTSIFIVGLNILRWISREIQEYAVAVDGPDKYNSDPDDIVENQYAHFCTIVLKFLLLRSIKPILDLNC